MKDLMEKFTTYARRGYTITELTSNKLIINLLKLDEKFIKFVLHLDMDQLINDPDSRVRIAVAMQGYGLEKLVNDENPLVRQAVALQGYKLDQLINDPDWHVRIAVAIQGYKLNQLINDPDWRVRLIIASNGYYLDQLIYDPDWHVRKEVAKQGELEASILVYDNHPSVSKTAKYICISKGFSF